MLAINDKIRILKMKTMNLLVNLGVLSILTMGHQAKAATFGHPDEDALVGALRNSFQTAETSPTLESIVGKWICHSLSASRGSIGVYTHSLEITHSKNDIVLLRYNNDDYFMPFFVNEDGFYSSDLSFGRQKDGNLIFEYVDSYADNSESEACAISLPEFKAMGYASCQKDSQQ
jgi:hypothetical protein